MMFSPCFSCRLLLFREDIDCTTYLSYLASDDGDSVMKTVEETRMDLENLRREYRRAASILAMMEKGTNRKDLARMRTEELGPIEEEIRRLEVLLRHDVPMTP